MAQPGWLCHEMEEFQYVFFKHLIALNSGIAVLTLCDPIMFFMRVAL